MSAKDYAALRLRPEWQKRRLQIMQRDNFQCWHCRRETTETLNVHHRYYVKGRMPWDYPDWALVTLCQDHHGFEHECSPDMQDWERMINAAVGGSPYNLNIGIHLFSEIGLAGKKHGFEKVYQTLIDLLERMNGE